MRAPIGYTPRMLNSPWFSSSTMVSKAFASMMQQIFLNKASSCGGMLSWDLRSWSSKPCLGSSCMTRLRKKVSWLGLSRNARIGVRALNISEDICEKLPPRFVIKAHSL